MVEVSTTESFRDPMRLPGLGLTSATDLMGKMELAGLPSDQEIFYREMGLLTAEQQGQKAARCPPRLFALARSTCAARRRRLPITRERHLAV